MLSAVDLASGPLASSTGTATRKADSPSTDDGIITQEIAFVIARNRGFDVYSDLPANEGDPNDMSATADQPAIATTETATDEDEEDYQVSVDELREGSQEWRSYWRVISVRRDARDVDGMISLETVDSCWIDRHA